MMNIWLILLSEAMSSRVCRILSGEFASMWARRLDVIAPPICLVLVAISLINWSRSNRMVTMTAPHMESARTMTILRMILFL